MEKQQIEALAKQHEQLRTGFQHNMESFARICKDSFLGFQCEGEGIPLVGFGEAIHFAARFIIHDGKGYGLLSAYSANDSPAFYEIYYRGDIPVFIRDLGQQTVNFYGNQLMDMEKLLTEIIGEFLNQDCFKP